MPLIPRFRLTAENWVWDVVLLEFVPMTQPGGGSGGGDASAANQVIGNASLASIDGKLPAMVGGRIPVVLPAGGSGLTDAELRATPVPVSGPLTDTQLRLTPVPVLTSDVAGTPVALNALNAAASVALAGLPGAGVSFAAGTLVGTVVPELSFDGGATWAISTTAFLIDTPQPSFIFAGALPAQSVEIQLVSGATHARVRVSAYTSGTTTATVRATVAKGPDRMSAQGQDGIPLTYSGTNTTLLVGGVGTDTNLHTFRTTTAAPTGVEEGLIVRPIPSGLQTIAPAGGSVIGLTDSVTGPVAVTPASTAAVAADKALVTRTVQLPSALAAGGGLKIEGVAGGVAVPISGTIATTGGLTNTELRASAVPVSPLALVADVPQTYEDGSSQPLSLTTDGRLRVSTAPSLVDQVWQGTFDSPWGTIISAADIDYSFAGASYV